MHNENVQTFFPIDEVYEKFESIKHEIDKNTENIIKNLYEDFFLNEVQKNETDLKLLQLRSKTFKILQNTVEPYRIVGETKIAYTELLQVATSALHAITDAVQELKNDLYYENMDSMYEDRMETYLAMFGRNIVLTFGGSLLLWSADTVSKDIIAKLDIIKKESDLDSPENPV